MIQRRSNQKLELTWIGKDEQPRLEPRILIEDPERSYGAKNSENMLIYGDNLLALKALEQDFAGKVKCVFIDPPYNTGSAFDHYDDGIEHSLWLSMMRDRVLLLHRLIAAEGSFFVTLDDNEAHYFRVLADEIFGRRNFVGDIAWQKKYSPGNNQKGLSSDHDHILLYAKNVDKWQWNLLPRSEKQDKAYKNPDNDPRGPWKASDLTRAEHRDRDYYPIVTPSGKEVWPAKGRSWSRPPAEIERLRNDKRLWFGPDGDSKPSLKRFLNEVQEGVVARTVWLRDEVGDNEEAKKEAKWLNEDDIFQTPKPERLLERIIHLATMPGDLVLDSFLGSGTTASVAHKMNRKWIGIELGEHCHTHCLPRLKKVIDGTDEGGISKAINWQRGGGFKYYYLAPSLLKEDKYGNWIIDERYNANMLAAAMAKHEGFKYSPDEAIYWKQGRSTEKDYIFTTTKFVTVEHLDKIHEEMQPGESLLICCKSFQVACDNRYPNITVKKIPKMLLGRCEFGKEDYSLNIVNMPVEQDEPDFEPDKETKGNKKKTKKAAPIKAPGLFSGEDD